MSLRDFNQITLSASKFWESQFKPEQSTECSFEQNSQPSLIEIAAQKIEQNLFEDMKLIENQHCQASESECSDEKKLHIINQQGKLNLDQQTCILDCIKNVVEPENQCHVNGEFFSKLKNIKNSSDCEETMIKTTQLIASDVDKKQKIKELKLLIEKMEYHLDETKKQILQTYLSQ